MLPENLILAFLLIFALRVCDVSLGTVRTVFILQGRKRLSAGIGFIEVMIFIFAISQVINGLNSPILMVGYAAGFATGTLVGVMLEERLAFGNSQLRIISRGKAQEIAEKFWDNDFGATIVPGQGKDGPVELVFSIVPRRTMPQCIKLASGVDENCVINVNDNRYLYGGHLGIHGKRK